MGKKLLSTTILCLCLLCNDANAQTQEDESDANNRGIDLTEIVVTALVLGFGYSVLQSFKSKNE